MSQPERPASPLPPNPPPWTCHADIYAIPFYVSPSSTSSLSSSFLQAPLEASHEPTLLANLCRPVGGLGMLQIIRYKDTPVGPYDEMVVMPGSYSWARTEEDRKGKKGAARRVEGRNPRVTRIYVSQRETCYYGRKYWNIPKHLASFTFTTNPDSSLTLTLRPFSSDSISPSLSSSPPSSPPFFTTTFHPTPYTPPFPVTLATLSPFTQTRIVLPPLPASSNPDESSDLICGTDQWCAFTPKVKSWRTKVGWFDMRQQPEGEDDDDRGGDGARGGENFWPGWGRWRFGLWMKDAEVVFEEPETWKHADAREVKP